MTLPSGRSPAGAERAIELVAAVEATAPNRDRTEMLQAVAAVLGRWNDPVDERFTEQIDGIVAVIGEIARIIDVVDIDQAATVLNGWLAQAGSAPRLVDEPGWGWHFHVEPEGAEWPDWLLASTAHALAVALVEHGRPVWGRCAAPGCGRPFFDHGRRAPQRFCSPACATRQRVRRHRAGRLGSLSSP